MINRKRLLAIAEHNMATAPNGLGSRATIGMQCACKYCGQDIEFHGRAAGWIDRGAGRSCLPFIRKGEIVRPTTKHPPGAR